MDLKRQVHPKRMYFTLLEGKDVIKQVRTGTGKTAAFGTHVRNDFF